jgi:hypothetical protein
MHTGPAVFVLVVSVSLRNADIRKLVEAGGLDFQGSMIQLKELLSEPDALPWQNFGHSVLASRISNGSRLSDVGNHSEALIPSFLSSTLV